MRVAIKWTPPNSWQSWLLASTGVYLLALTGLTTGEFVGALRPREAVVEPLAFKIPDIPPADLVVSEASFTGPAEHRMIAGILKNRSAKAYADVRITFSLVGSNGDTVGVAAATVNQLGGRESVKFQAPEVSDPSSGSVEIVVKQIDAKPASPRAP